MKLVELILISLGLAMDAFAVSVCKGLSMMKMNWKKALIIGGYFGGFQALMPLIGYFLGSNFENVVINIDHWIAFVLLLMIGINMVKESRTVETENCNDDTSFKTMLLLAIATSIDALAVGITFAFLKVNIILSCFCSTLAVSIVLIQFNLFVFSVTNALKSCVPRNT